MKVYQSPWGRRFYVRYSGIGSMYFIYDTESILHPFPVGTAFGLPAAIQECDAAYRKSLQP